MESKLAVINALKSGPALMQSAIDGYYGESGLEHYIADVRETCKASAHPQHCSCALRIKLCIAVLNNSRSKEAPISAIQLYQCKQTGKERIHNVLYKLRHLPFTFIKVHKLAACRA
jgi:hypothetical protein